MYSCIGALHTLAQVIRKSSFLFSARHGKSTYNQQLSLAILSQTNKTVKRIKSEMNRLTQRHGVFRSKTNLLCYFTYLYNNVSVLYIREWSSCVRHSLFD